tara:strand:+ start:1216 stop:1350 length:135 start_codon:yes stop_codon:yes gene_type:complete
MELKDWKFSVSKVESALKILALAPNEIDEKTLCDWLEKNSTSEG